MTSSIPTARVEEVQKPKFHEYFVAAIPAVIGVPVGLLLMATVFGIFPGIVVLWLATRPLVKLVQRDIAYELFCKDEPLPLEFSVEVLPWEEDD